MQPNLVVVVAGVVVVVVGIPRTWSDDPPVESPFALDITFTNHL